MTTRFVGRAELLVLLLALLSAVGATAAAASGGTSGAFPAASPEEVGMSAEALAALSAAVARYVEEGEVVGAELLVIMNERTVLHEAFGQRDREDGLPMERGAIFNIRSMTKPLVGAAAQILIDEGRLALDQPVRDFLPGFDNEASRSITVEHLLTHRSGLPLGIVQGLNDFPDVISMGNAAGGRGPEFEPGSRFSYSDAGSDALGAVVEAASGMPLEEFVRTRLLEPLGMRDTFATLDPDDARWSRVASLYIGSQGAWLRHWKPEGKPMYPFLWGSQGLYSTCEDYARFVSLWMNGGVVGDRAILSPAAIRRTLTPVSAMMAPGSDIRQPTNFTGMEIWYGQMALLHIPVGAGAGAEPTVIGHSGSDGTVVWAWPDRDLIVLYFTQSRGNLSHLRFERALEWLILDPENHRVPPDPARLAPFLGTYAGTVGSLQDARFVVLERDGFLAVDVPGQFSTELRDPAPDGWWRSVFIDRVSVSFDVADSGEATAMRWRDGGEVFVLPRAEQPAAGAPDTEALFSRLAGTYRDPEAARDVAVVVHNGGLAVDVPGAGLVELDGPDNDEFFRLRLNPSVRIRFDEDAGGEIVSYTVHTPDGSTYVRPRLGGAKQAMP